jgi:hypothetical protein
MSQEGCTYRIIAFLADRFPVFVRKKRGRGKGEYKDGFVIDRGRVGRFEPVEATPVPRFSLGAVYVAGELVVEGARTRSKSFHERVETSNALPEMWKRKTEEERTEPQTEANLCFLLPAEFWQQILGAVDQPRNLRVTQMTKAPDQHHMFVVDLIVTLLPEMLCESGGILAQADKLLVELRVSCHQVLPC